MTQALVTSEPVPLVVGMATQVSISMPHWRPNQTIALRRPGQNRRQNR